MIKVIVKRPVQELVGGKAEFEVEATSIGQLIEILDQQYPGFRNSVLGARGEIRSSINFLLSQERKPGYFFLERIEDLHRELPDGATIHFDLRRIAGG